MSRKGNNARLIFQYCTCHQHRYVPPLRIAHGKLYPKVRFLRFPPSRTARPKNVNRWLVSLLLCQLPKVRNHSRLPFRSSSSLFFSHALPTVESIIDDEDGLQINGMKRI